MIDLTHRLTEQDRLMIECGALRRERDALAARLAEAERILGIWVSEYNLPDNFYDPKGLVMATRNILRSTDSADEVRK
jgi:hypothetical protein